MGGGEGALEIESPIHPSRHNGLNPSYATFALQSTTGCDMGHLHEQKLLPSQMVVISDATKMCITE